VTTSRLDLVLGIATSLVNAALIGLAHPFAAMLFVPIGNVKVLLFVV